jgi:FKBP-type peptidyl-prolyl cis-trans isomerase (trigger factor)
VPAVCPGTPRPPSRVQRRRQTEGELLSRLGAVADAVTQLRDSFRQHQLQYALDQQAVMEQMAQVQQAFVNIAEGVVPRALRHIADTHRLQVQAHQQLREQEARATFLSEPREEAVCALCQQRLCQSPPPSF